MMIPTKLRNRRLLHQTLMYLVAFTVFFQAGQALAADTLIDIFFLPHRPALAVVSEVEKISAEFPDTTIQKYSFENPDNKELLKKYNLTGHMPVAIFINGKNSFTVNGEKKSLRNFPKGNTFVPLFAGEWDYDDLRSILREISGGM